MVASGHMAPLTSTQRKRLPSNVYALPAQRKYPVPDKAHARNAKARASEEYRKGNLTKSEYDRVNRKADLMLYGGSRGGHHVYMVDESGKGAPRSKVKPDNQPSYKMRANVPRRASATTAKKKA